MADFLSEQTFFAVLDKHIKEIAEDIIEEEAQAAADRIHARIRRDVGKIVLRVLSSYSVERRGQSLIIEVKLPDQGD
jgi:hypothetical protein